jgi:hypothetical protein
LKKRLKTVRNLNKLIFIAFFFIFGCCYKPSVQVRAPVKKIYSGNLWLEIKTFNKNQTKTFSSYADFQVSEDFLYLRLKSPFNTTLGYGKWEASSFNTIEIFDLYHKKHYLINFQKKPELKNIPLYFLGMKEKSLNWDFLKISFKYSFDEAKKEGMIISETFQLRWKIKTLLISETFKPMLENVSLTDNLSEVKITF